MNNACRTGALVVVLAGYLTAGCDTTINPNLGTDLPFSMWGLFNPKTSVHAVRVFEIGETLQLVGPDPLDARVQSTDLETGEVRIWADSVVTLEDGDFRHVYWDSFPAPVGHTFRLEVSRSDGTTSRATTTIPPPIALELAPVQNRDIFTGKQYVHILGEPPALPRIDLVFKLVASLPVANIEHFIDMVFQYEADATPSEEGWVLEIDLRRDYLEIISRLDQLQLPTAHVELYELDLTVHVGDSQWISPTGIIDPLALVEPGTFSNVDNGFGFVGAGYTESISWRPPEELLERVGFAF